MNHTTENERLLDDFLRARAIEEKMLIYLRQGKISKWFSSFGQEALSVAATHALASDEYICTMHRNLGVFIAREVPLLRLFAQFASRFHRSTQDITGGNLNGAVHSRQEFGYSAFASARGTQEN